MIEQQSIVEYLGRGGWTMIPLAVCSLLALAVVVERLIWGIRRQRAIPENLCHDINELVTKNRLDEIVGLCRADKSALARITLVVLKNLGRPRDEIVEAIELAGRREALALQRYLGVLSTIAAIAPLLGLLGTVSGMITTFSVIKTQGTGNAIALAGGISEALITTATGLVIAIPALVFYRYFAGKSRQLILELEQIAVQLLDHLSHRGDKEDAVKHVSEVQ